MMTGIRVAVVDDHPLFREGVTRSLSEIDGFEVVAEGGSRDEAIAIAQNFNPDVMLLDISMPGGGLNAIPAILSVAPSQKIVMLTVSEANDDVAAALKEGAKGYLLKGIGARALADVIRTVASGESYVAPTLSAKLLTGQLANPAPAKSNLVAELTRREQEVLHLVASGMSNKKTVKHHMTQIMAKLDVANRTEAAMVLRDALDWRPVSQ